MAEASCKHSFADPTRAHYCNYIQVPGLLDSFYPQAVTTDEITLCSGLYSYVLWWNLQEKELAALLATVQASATLTPEKCYDAIKRANRLVEIGRILLQQGVILRSELLRRKANINFRFADAGTNQLAVFANVARLTQQVEAALYKNQATPADPATERLLASFSDLVLNHADMFVTVRRDFRDLLWTLHEQPAPRVVEFGKVVPARKLLTYAQDTIAKHHPQCLADARLTNDELTFITAHQTFEVWFPTVIGSIKEATDLLRQRPAKVWEAEALARRIADIFSLFGRMIHIPQTMTAADYIEFRDQLQAGSGVESYQFRAIELSAGLRDPRYLRAIEHMQLLTEDLQMLRDAPSLNDAVMELLTDRRITGVDDLPAQAAQKLANTLLPSGVDNANVDIMALTESLVRFEQNVELWRTDHIAMVTRMIGRKTGTGAATFGQMAHGHADEEMYFDSLPYLRNTLKYRKIFPTLWDARDFLHEKVRI
jgi:tryptophan 2,3-dioxygenase